MDYKDFFKRYGESYSDGEKLAAFYGDCALATTPEFVGCLKDRKDVRKALSGIAHYQEKTGMTSMVPLHVQANEIDPRHAIVKVHWGAKFKKTGDQEIVFDVSYLVRHEKGKEQILLIISHQDEQKMRQELGLS